MTETLEGLLLDIYRRNMEIKDPSQMRFDDTLLAEEGDDLDEFDELQELLHPEFFTCDLQSENAIFNNFCIVDIQFGRYEGQKIILKQHDGPFLVYWKGVDLNWRGATAK